MARCPELLRALVVAPATAEDCPDGTSPNRGHVGRQGSRADGCGRSLRHELRGHRVQSREPSFRHDYY